MTTSGILEFPYKPHTADTLDIRHIIVQTFFEGMEEAIYECIEDSFTYEDGKFIYEDDESMSEEDALEDLMSYWNEIDYCIFNCILDTEVGLYEYKESVRLYKFMPIVYFEIFEYMEDMGFEYTHDYNKMIGQCMFWFVCEYTGEIFELVKKLKQDTSA